MAVKLQQGCVLTGGIPLFRVPLLQYCTVLFIATTLQVSNYSFKFAMETPSFLKIELSMKRLIILPIKKETFPIGKTFLNVKSLDNILKVWRRCFHSFYTYGLGSLKREKTLLG